MSGEGGVAADTPSQVRAYVFEVGEEEDFAEAIRRLGEEVGLHFYVLDDPAIVYRLRRCTGPLKVKRTEVTREEFVARLVAASTAAAVRVL